ncbi:MAG: SGNH/GDSL hydrolase family protein [Bacteroidales bacterium]|nr:SGNH/GDSL hydrolase family protein [Bacteroidales bacterium]
MKKLVYILFSLVILAGCEPKIDELSPNQGSADFSRFVSVGNSLTAGFADGALYFSAQNNSFPNLLAQQFQLAGGGTFVQPVVNSEFGVEFPGSLPRLILGFSTSCAGTSMGPVPDIGPRDPVAPVGYLVNNLGIPGAKSFHLLAQGYAMLNPYYARFATSATNMVIQEIPPLNPTFFSLWIGNNDVLGYATSGGVGDTITGLPMFGSSMGVIVNSLVGVGTKGVIANIPDITSAPFFNTIPYNGLTLNDSLANLVNYAMGLFGLPFVYHAGPNPFLVADPTSPHPYFKVRQMQPGELVLLTAPQDSMKCYGMGLISSLTLTPWPLPNQFVLTQDEIDNINTAVAGYNQIIAGLAQTHGLALADMNTRMKNLEQGIIWDGIRMNTKFVTGGVFSLDGIHPNSRGYALITNYFIDAINAEYGSTVPHVDITKYPGVAFP